MTAPVLSIILLSWNTCDLLRDCLRSLTPFPPEWELMVVDNASSDSSAAVVQNEFPYARLIINTENLGFARGNNQGIAASTGDYVLLLNSDTLVKPAALVSLVRFMDEHPDAGAVSPRLLRLDGTPQPYAFGGDPTPGYLLRRGLTQIVFRRHLHDWGTEQLQAVDWVSGACLLVLRAAIEQIGLLDENMFMYFEDNDWCLRIRKAGWKVYYYPQTEIVHLGGQSLKKNPQAQQVYFSSLRYFYRKHYTLWMRVFLASFLPIYRWLSGR
ncbi:MAG: glycosyltransferase family 2 protein [Anaerolineae bacterium]|nr:glycosyltransferase family 2 protein [Anaerolineae bacterium]